jgi:AcrR family transcriptional regulator
VSGPDSTGAIILDATMRVLADYGFRRATVESVAEYADVPLMTLQRRWPTKVELFRAAMRRELALVFTEAFDTAAAEEGFDDLVASAFSDAVWALHNHPLMVRELSIDRDSTLSVLATEWGPAMTEVVDVVAERLSLAADATDRVLADQGALADTFVRLAHAFLLVPDPGRPLTSRDDIESYARSYLVPLAKSGVTRRSGALASAQMSTIDSKTRRKSARRRPLQLAIPAAIALLLGSGALATAIVQPWSEPATPITVTDSGPTPTPSPEEEVVTLPPGGTGIGSLQTSPAAVPQPPAVVTPTADPQLTVPTVRARQPVVTGGSGADGNHAGPPPGGRPPMQPKPGLRPPVPPGPGAPHQSNRPPGPGGGPPGPGQHPGGPGGGAR